MNSQRQVTYEIHVNQNGRWELHARYSADQKKAAIEEAKQLDRQSGIGPVRLVKDEFDPETNTSSEFTIYKSPGKAVPAASQAPRGLVVQPTRRPATPGRSRSGAAARSSSRRDKGGAPVPNNAASIAAAGAPGPEEQRREAVRQARARSSLSLVLKVLLIVVFSVAAAALFTGGTTILVRESALFALSQQEYAQMLFGVFTLSFVGTALLMAFTFISRADLVAWQAGPREAPAPPPPANERLDALPPLPTIEPGSVLDDDTEDTEAAPVAVISADEAAQPTPDPASGPAPAPATAEEAAAALSQDAAKASPIEVPEGLPDTAAWDRDEDDEQGALEDKIAYETPRVQAKRMAMMNFLTEALRAVKAKQPTLDSYNRFGINLFLAGCSETLAADTLSDYAARRILREAVELLGTRHDHAETLAANYEAYLVADPRYMQAFEAGRSAMANYVDGTPPGTALIDALADWNAPRSRDATAAPVAVLFTDIVGSTAITQTRGDQAAQEVLRTHNRIVRNAVVVSGGREVKHTGDGIMASFPVASAAVLAAIAIQQRIRAHNEATPELSFELRIGISAGEPIREDNDLFGSTVQLAARLCGEAEAGAVLVSDVVRGLCAGKDLVFVSEGMAELKGFREPVPVFSVPVDPRLQHAAAQQAEPATDPDASPADQMAVDAAAGLGAPPTAPTLPTAPGAHGEAAASTPRAGPRKRRRRKPGRQAAEAPPAGPRPFIPGEDFS